jgi:WD40 repeat protein
MLRIGACLGVVIFVGFAAGYRVSLAGPPGASAAEIIHKLNGHQGEVVSVAFSATGREMYSASDDGQICVWEVATGKQVRRLELKLEDELSRFMPRFPRRGRDTFVLLAPGGKFAAAVWGHRNFRLFELRTGEEVCDFGQFSMNQQAVAFSPDGTLLATSHFNRDGDRISIRIWEADSGKRVNQLASPSMVSTLVFSPDGKILACGNYKQGESNLDSISFLDLPSGKVRNRFQITGNGPLAFDGKKIVLRSENSLELWDAWQGKQIVSIPCKLPQISLPIFSPDGKTLTVSGCAADGQDSTVQLWEVATAKIRLEFPTQRGVVSAMAFSPDGKILASGIKKTVILWNITGTFR